MRLFTVLLLLAVAAAPGCFFSRSKVDKALDRDKLDEIMVGESNKEDVARLLGAPTDIIFNNKELDPLNVFAYEYIYKLEKTTGFTIILLTLTNSDTKRDHVLVFFDANGIVTGVGSRFEAEDAEYDLPFGD